jgi:hypothetical protein
LPVDRASISVRRPITPLAVLGSFARVAQSDRRAATPTRGGGADCWAIGMQFRLPLRSANESTRHT